MAGVGPGALPRGERRREALALRWESKELRKLGSAISKFLESQAKSYAAGLVGNAVIGAAFATIALPAQLMSFADYIDNAWTVAEQRADQAGEQLARALALRLHGHRPVTLVGYGMGARVVLKALLALSELDNDAGLGIVETAICLGTPDSADSQLWARAASVCGHRLVNGYHEKDWVLGFVYRATTTTLSIAGLQRVAAGHGSGYLLENVDLTDTLRGHWDYREKLKELVEMTGVTSGFTDYSKKPVIERAEKESPNGKKSKPLCMDIFLDEDEFLERPHSR
ncbi:hypothetical protein GUITHDRAFT_90895 [Guillardia theta CCMP2712]|uniref:DUF726 domain-containing protein n=1 Tax=Guillardia theta (strain CCMP2712) TaxID=905079 RepID=L1I9Z8_GUITC|nr:hypothetical protein GUITHDRAFT_90895 [Guillardia theta CCMP2712]EKX32912.1 hypothetical protein GUITHDRAFT_90895 [Guillardia theta CCMP2712]|eukprot:XP_005819892.1 hypothetical protein GUITHDRAFT_90895 [Guillardia theta CCMP2712]